MSSPADAWISLPRRQLQQSHAGHVFMYVVYGRWDEATKWAHFWSTLDDMQHYKKAGPTPLCPDPEEEYHSIPQNSFPLQLLNASTLNLLFLLLLWEQNPTCLQRVKRPIYSLVESISWNAQRVYFLYHIPTPVHMMDPVYSQSRSRSSSHASSSGQSVILNTPNDPTPEEKVRSREHEELLSDGSPFKAPRLPEIGYELPYNELPRSEIDRQRQIPPHHNLAHTYHAGVDPTVPKPPSPSLVVRFKRATRVFWA
jgi:hypothetical protein